MENAPFFGFTNVVCLFDLLTLLNKSKSTGTIFIKVHDLDGSISFHAGLLTHAQFSVMKGVQALSRLILAGPCRYELKPLDSSLKDNISTDTADLLEKIKSVLTNWDQSFLSNMLTSNNANEEDLLVATECLDDATIGAQNIENKSFTEIFARKKRTPQAFDIDPEQTIQYGNDDRSVGTEQFSAFKPPSVGDTLGKCRIDKEIGIGTSSIVYKAFHNTFRLDVALKVLMPGSRDIEREKLLTAHEAQLLARIHHPSVLRVYDFDISGNFPYLTMEYLDAGTIGTQIKERGKLSPQEALFFIKQAAEGLQHAHDNLKIIHCDIKPGNILTCSEGTVRIADLGLSRGSMKNTIAEEVDEEMSNVIAGTPAYIAPEQVNGGVAQTDFRSDIYSLGATLFHAMTGKTVFEDTNPLRLMAKQVSEPLPNIREEYNFPTDVNNLLYKMLAKAPSDRFQTYEDLIAELDNIIKNNYIDGQDKRTGTTFWKTIKEKIFKTEA